MLKFFPVTIFFIMFSFCQAMYIIETRIVNGKDATKSEFPWIINMVNRPLSDHRCGGVIINKDWVLTAGHCVTEINASQIQVIAGDYNRSEPDNSKQRKNVEEFIMHPKYIPNSKVNVSHDFALLRVSNPYEFTDSVKKVNLPQKLSVINQDKMTLAGWGYTNAQKHVAPEILQKVNLNVFPVKECRQLYSFLEFTDEMFCGGNQESSACNGDSGSGFIEVTTHPTGNCKIHVLYGIVSYGKSDCAGGEEFPTIFGNVPSILDWIFEITGENSSIAENTCQIDHEKENEGNNTSNIGLKINFRPLLCLVGLSLINYLRINTFA